MLLDEVTALRTNAISADAQLEGWSALVRDILFYGFLHGRQQALLDHFATSLRSSIGEVDGVSEVEVGARGRLPVQAALPQPAFPGAPMSVFMFMSVFVCVRLRVCMHTGDCPAAAVVDGSRALAHAGRIPRPRVLGVAVALGSPLRPGKCDHQPQGPKVWRLFFDGARSAAAVAAVTAAAVAKPTREAHLPGWRASAFASTFHLSPSHAFLLHSPHPPSKTLGYGAIGPHPHA
jgi:hypothetical protein